MAMTSTHSQQSPGAQLHAPAAGFAHVRDTGALAHSGPVAPRRAAFAIAAHLLALAGIGVTLRFLSLVGAKAWHAAPTMDNLMLAVISAVAAAALVWLAALVGLGLIWSLPLRREGLLMQLVAYVLERSTPASYRKWLITALGAAVISTANPAWAAEDPSWGAPTAPASTASTTDSETTHAPSAAETPLPTPTDPTIATALEQASDPSLGASDTEPAAATPTRISEPRQGRRVVEAGSTQDWVVHRGDTLWNIAAAHLTDPQPAAIAAEWPRWYEANRHVIGANPHLLLPGQILRHPDAPPG